MILRIMRQYIKYIVNRRKFRFDGRSLRIFFHSYNNFGVTERSIEIPIVLYFLNKSQHNNILEIGNVSNYYYEKFKNIKKTVVDKDEIAFSVINTDIKDFKSDKKYDFIYSISTFEHMDSNCGRNKDEFIKSIPFSSTAFSNMDYVINNLLSKNGRFIITFRLNYCNKEIDNSLERMEERYFNATVKKHFIKNICVMEVVKR